MRRSSQGSKREIRELEYSRSLGKKLFQKRRQQSTALNGVQSLIKKTKNSPLHLAMRTLVTSATAVSGDWKVSSLVGGCLRTGEERPEKMNRGALEFKEIREMKWWQEHRKKYRLRGKYSFFICQ